MDDSYIYVIVALLPLAAVMLTVQVNPYHALVIRGILGAVAALVYAVLGAADVALTEALVGTMLAITLYAVAVRSSLVMRVGILDDGLKDTDYQHSLNPLIDQMRTIVRAYHLRLELIPYPNSQCLDQALAEKEVHVTCIERSPQSASDLSAPELAEPKPSYHTVTRIRRLYDILKTDLPALTTDLTYMAISSAAVPHLEEINQ